MLMSTGGTVIKVPVEDVKRLGRSTQGVIVMRTRDGEEVSTLAPVVEQADVTGRTATSPRWATKDRPGRCRRAGDRRRVDPLAGLCSRVRFQQD
jgi:hypothetical protein